MKTQLQGKNDFSIEESMSFTKWLQSENALRASIKIPVCLLLQNVLQFSTGWISVEKIAVTGMWAAPAATFMKLPSWQAKIWTTNILILFCGHATYEPLSQAFFHRPLAELEKFGPRIVPLFKLPSLVQGVWFIIRPKHTPILS